MTLAEITAELDAATDLDLPLCQHQRAARASLNVAAWQILKGRPERALQMARFAVAQLEKAMEVAKEPKTEAA